MAESLARSAATGKCPPQPRRFRASLIGSILIVLGSGCGTNEPQCPGSRACGETGTGATAGSGGAGGATTGGTGGSRSDASPDTVPPPDALISDPDDPNCRFASPAPAVCHVAGSPLARSPQVRCEREPSQILDRVDDLSFFDMQGGVLYWLADGDGSIVRRVGTTTEAVVTYPYRASYFLTDASAIYFLSLADGGTASLYRMNLDRTGLTELTSDIWSRFVLDDERIYFDTTDGKFSSIAKTGGPVEFQPGPTSVTAVTRNRRGLIDGTHLYWTEGTSPDFTLKRVVKRTTQIETVGEHLPGAAIQVEGDGVLLADRGYIFEVPKAGGCPKVLVSGSDNLIADEQAIYWSSAASNDMQNHLLYRTPRTGGINVEVIAGSSRLAGRGSLLLTPAQLVIWAETISYQPGIWTVARN